MPDFIVNMLIQFSGPRIMILPELFRNVNKYLDNSELQWINNVIIDVCNVV